MRSPSYGLCRGGGALVALIAAYAFAGCDRDPNSPSLIFPRDTVLNASVIGLQEPIRVLFRGPISSQSALDPANFVVTNQCSGLGIPGSLQQVGDTLIFSPGQALPYLIRVGVRIQNLQTPTGAQLPAPITFTLTTIAPPVSDLSWQSLNSPVNEPVSGINFSSRTVGYFTTVGGTIYRTTNGGANFGVRFQQTGITSTQGMQVFGPGSDADSLFLLGAVSSGTAIHQSLLRSTDAGATITEAALLPVPSAFSLSMTRLTGGAVRGIIGGQTSSPVVMRYDASSGGLTNTVGLPAPDFTLSQVAISPDGSRALVTAAGKPGTSSAGRGALYRSTDGGVTFVQVALPGTVYSLRGIGFIDNNIALALGDSSGVYRVDVASGSSVAIGGGAGIPQSARDAATQSATTFSFRKAHFVRGSPIGWVIGNFNRTIANQPNLSAGVLLITRDGGLSFSRQAVTGAQDNGLNFPFLLDVQALATDFAVTSGLSGFVAARKTNPPGNAAICSLTSSP